MRLIQCHAGFAHGEEYSGRNQAPSSGMLPHDAFFLSLPLLSLSFLPSFLLAVLLTFSFFLFFQSSDVLSITQDTLSTTEQVDALRRPAIIRNEEQSFDAISKYYRCDVQKVIALNREVPFLGSSVHDSSIPPSRSMVIKSLQDIVCGWAAA